MKKEKENIVCSWMKNVLVPLLHDILVIVVIVVCREIMIPEKYFF